MARRTLASRGRAMPTAMIFCRSAFVRALATSERKMSGAISYCGQPLKACGTEDSEQIDIEITVFRRVIHASP